MSRSGSARFVLRHPASVPGDTRLVERDRLGSRFPPLRSKGVTQIVYLYVDWDNQGQVGTHR